MDSLRDIELPTFEFDFDNNFQDSDEELLNACLELEQYEQYLSNEDPNVAKKARFAEVGSEELDKLLQDAQATGTKKTTKWAALVFKG